MPPMEFESMFEFTLKAGSRMPLIMVLTVSFTNLEVSVTSQLRP